MKVLAEKTKAREEAKLRAKRLSEIRAAVAQLEEEMKKTEQLFNLAADEYLIESYIYESSAQTARMNYLCRMAREL